MNLSKRDFLQVMASASVAGMALGRFADADAATVPCTVTVAGAPKWEAERLRGQRIAVHRRHVISRG